MSIMTTEVTLTEHDIKKIVAAHLKQVGYSTSHKDININCMHSGGRTHFKSVTATVTLDRFKNSPSP